jgi:flagellin
MENEAFNGISLFSVDPALVTSGEASLTVLTSEDGATQSVDISKANIGFINETTLDLTDITTYTGAEAAVAAVRTGIENLAQLRAQNGAEQSRLSFSADMLAVNKTNLEAANSRIIDVDVASESTQLARYNILQQAGTAMLAQANQATQSILRLLQ